jgi:hypothetical protein
MDIDRFYASTQIYLIPYYSLLENVLRNNIYSDDQIFNLDETNYRIPSSWKISVVIPNNQPLNNQFLTNSENIFNNEIENENNSNNTFIESEESESENIRNFGLINVERESSNEIVSDYPSSDIEEESGKENDLKIKLLDVNPQLISQEKK